MSGSRNRWNLEWGPGAVLAGVLVSLAALGVLVVLLAGNQGIGGAWTRALSLPLALGLVLAAVLAVSLVTAGVHWRRSREETSARPLGPAEGSVGSEVIERAAEAQARRAGEFVERVGDPGRRESMREELARLQAEGGRGVSRLDVVVFGTGSAGKTSLINALLGREAGQTEAVMGTTKHGAAHTYELRSVDAAVSLTDTPGLAEAGEDGQARETEARALAARADLLLFVVDHDLLRGEYQALEELARLGKRSIVVLNKKDRFPEEDLAVIVAKLRARLAGVIDPADIVAVMAAPSPVPVRLRRADGSTETVLEQEPPDIAPLRARIAEVLRREGKLLHAMNLLVRGRMLEQEAAEQVARERERKALEVIERHQWVTAGAVFANPIPALDILAGGAVQLEMIAELGRVYGVALSAGQVRALAGQMAQSILKLGLVETAASLIAGVFKRTLVGFAAGGAVQAVTMAYLTRVAGRAFDTYFRQGQSWGASGVDACLLEQFHQTSRAEFLQDFAADVVRRVLQKLHPTPDAGAGQTGDRAAEVSGAAGRKGDQ